MEPDQSPAPVDQTTAEDVDVLPVEPVEPAAFQQPGPDVESVLPGEAAVARYTHKLTREPGAIAETDLEDLRASGLGDLEILDANNMCAHLNYVNRIANGLGLRTEVGEEFEAFAAIPQ